MENQQTLSDFPIVDIWVDEDENQLVDATHVYSFQNTTLKYDYRHMVVGFFSLHFEPYTQSINIKKRNIDRINPNNINLVVVPCAHPNNINDLLKNITTDLYNWCESNNIKIAVCLTRETIYILNPLIINSMINLHLVKRGFKPSVVKIINNSYQNLPDIVNSEYFVSIDTIRRMLNFITKDWVKTISLSKDRKYNFSLLAGALYQRHNRVMLLSKCHDLKLLDDKFFYSVCMHDRERDLEYIKKLAASSEESSVILNACDSVFKHKTYGIDGRLLVDSSIYDDNVEFFMPPQVLDSYVHIVLETIDHVPSITEKIFKPIVVGLPFVWHGCYNLLPYLESLGFKRYSHIDYSFDSDPDPQRRLDLLIKEIQRLNKMDLKMLAYTNKKTSKHNQKVFQSICKDYNDLWKHLK